MVFLDSPQICCSSCTLTHIKIQMFYNKTGPEHFASTVFVTSKAELTVEGWGKHEAHGSLSAPLTDEEKNLEGIREAEAHESTGTAARRGGHIDGGGLTIPLPEDAVKALERLKIGEEGLVQLVSRNFFKSVYSPDVGCYSSNPSSP